MLPTEIAIDCEGEITGEKYKGLFKIKPRLSHRDLLIKDQSRRELLGKDGENAGQDALNMAEVFSKIWSHTLEAPTFWRESNRGLDLVDEVPVAQVYRKILEVEQETVKAIREKAEAAKAELAKEAPVK